MQTELEAKFLDIDPHNLRQRLRELGADLVMPERLMRRQIFHFPPEHAIHAKAYARVRDEGDKVTVTYKQVNDRTLHGTQEVNLVVNSFDQACSLLSALGLNPVAYQETKRESWKLGGTEIEIDTWPWIPTFVELESANGEQELKQTCRELGLDWDQALHGTVETAYQDKYSVTEAEVNAWPKITFTPVPDWLEAKRKEMVT